MAKRRPESKPEPEPDVPPTPIINPSASELLTTRDLMEYLQISRTKVWELVNKQGLPAFKLGGDYRYRRSEIDSWMEGLRVNQDDSGQQPQNKK